MAPPAAQMRKRKNKKKATGDDNEVIDMFGTQAPNGKSDFDMPLPPMMGQQEEQSAAAKKAVDVDDEDSEAEEASMPKRKGKKTDAAEQKLKKPKAQGSGIKTTPLILLILLTGTTLLPAFLYVGDHLSGFLGNGNLLSGLGYRLGVGAVPRQRVLSFYEKHNPEKITEVPTILSKHYGEYPKLIKKLERKYQDYGYFSGWEQDEAPLVKVREGLEEVYSYWIQSVWNRYAPVTLRTAARNAKFNFTKIYKKGTKIWKRKIWPLLEPYIGVPDERTAAKQKRKDADEARKRREASQGTSGSAPRRRKNTEFRDDVED